MTNLKGFNLVIVLILLGVGIIIGVAATILINKDAMTPVVSRDISIESPIISNGDIDEIVVGDEAVEESIKEGSGFIENVLSPSTNKLDLSNRGLTQVSQDIFKKTNLVELDVSNNRLTGALPGEIRHLQKLEVLNASNNQMTGVPAEVGQLSNLRILDLSNNQLTGLPHELGNLKKLEILNLLGNNYSKYDLDIIRPGLPNDVQIIE